MTNARVAADKDWIKDVRVDVINISKKAIMAIDVVLVVRQQGQMKQPAPFPMEFRSAQPGAGHVFKYLLPGETTTVRVFEYDRLLWMQFLRKYGTDDFDEVV